MGITVTTEKQFESDIEAFLISAEGGYTKGNGTYSPKLGLYPNKLISFMKRTQPREWAAKVIRKYQTGRWGNGANEQYFDSCFQPL